MDNIGDVTVRISGYGIEILRPGDQSMHADEMHRRATEVLRGHPFWYDNPTRRQLFRLQIAWLRLGREIEREVRYAEYRVNRLRHRY